MKREKVIYRIENSRKSGPYRFKYVSQWRRRNHNGPDHPNLYEDFSSSVAKEFFKGHWRCGFNSKKQLLNWFNKRELNTLIELGFKVVKIMPKALIKGKKQVIFKGRTKTQEVSLRDLW